MGNDEEYEPYHWQVGDPIGYGGDVGVPDYPYLDYLNNGQGNTHRRVEVYSHTSESKPLHDKAWKLRGEGRYEEALELINSALEYDQQTSDNWNVKAIILEDLQRYEEAIENYDEALKRNPKSKIIKNNKAYSLSRLAYKEKSERYNSRRALILINEALKLTSNEDNRREYLRFKGKLLEMFGFTVDAKVCHYLSKGMYDEVEKINEQRKMLYDSNQSFINITGYRFYRGLEPFKQGILVDLIREPENVHDYHAIRVEIDGECVGYVANSRDTLFDTSKSATDIKDMVKPNQKAKIMFIYAEEYVIAKLV